MSRMKQPGKALWYAMAALWCLLLVVMSVRDLFPSGAVPREQAIEELRGELVVKMPTYHPELVNATGALSFDIEHEAKAANFVFFSGRATLEEKSVRFLAAYRSDVSSGNLVRANVLCSAGDNAFVITGRTTFLDAEGALTSGQTRIFTDTRVNYLVFLYVGALALAVLFVIQGRRVARRQAEQQQYDEIMARAGVIEEETEAAVDAAAQARAELVGKIFGDDEAPEGGKDDTPAEDIESITVAEEIDETVNAAEKDADATQDPEKPPEN